jgi:hypothetical protein
MGLRNAGMCVMAAKSARYGRDRKTWLALSMVVGSVLYVIAYPLFVANSGSGGGGFY